MASFLFITAAVFGLASWGGWAGMSGVFVVLGIVLAGLIQLGDGVPPVSDAGRRKAPQGRGRAE
jgi:hypothetical protein